MEQITAAIITIGDELLIGQTVDTNSAWMGSELNRIGIWVHRRVAVGDDKRAIVEALDEEGRRSDIILITGGLGPTADDITKPVLCGYFGGQLVEDPVVVAQLEKRLAASSRTLSGSLRKQAMVPDVCSVLYNDWGTAPAMWFEKEGRVYASLPGVPYEMQQIMAVRVIPRLKEQFRLPVILHRTLSTMGLGETDVAARLHLFESSLPPELRLAYLPGAGMLKLRLTARGDDPQRTAAGLEQHFGLMESLLADIEVADDDIPLEAWVGQLLKKMNKTLATAESCTGGYIASRITSVAGSSDYFKGSVVSYANKVKTDVLGVAEAVLEQHGAVSEQTVVAMEEGVRTLLHTDFAVSISGILGPGGGTPAKPVGTVWIAAGSVAGTITRRLQLRYSRSHNTEIAANYALNLLRQAIIGQGKA